LPLVKDAGWSFCDHPAIVLMKESIMIKLKFDRFSVLLLVLLLILTAWGNAYAFFVFGLLALCVGFVFFQLHAKKTFIIAVSVSSFIAIVAGILIFIISW
jgi:hypothetical protein